MNRNILAIATALIAAPALFASAAQACISCEYVPEVVRSSSTLPHTGHYYSAAPYERKAVERNIAVERSAPAKKRIVKSEPVAKKAVDTAETASITKQAKNENSSISANAEIASTEPVKVEQKPARSESSSIALASTEAAAPAKAAVAETKEAAAKPVDCKKFFPSVGITLSVPCE